MLALTRELESQRDIKEALRSDLESASSEHDCDMAAVSMALTDVDKLRERAGKYECEVDNLQRNLQQTSDRWQKTAVIQAEQAELVKTHQKVMANLQSKCAVLCSENKALQLQHRQELKANREAQPSDAESQRRGSPLSRHRQCQEGPSSRLLRGSPLGCHCQRRGGTGHHQHRRLPLSRQHQEGPSRGVLFHDVIQQTVWECFQHNDMSCCVSSLVSKLTISR